MDEYTSFGLSATSLAKQMKAYISYRDYDNPFGDMVPLVLARAYDINITILDTSNSDRVTVHKIYPRVESDLAIAVQHCRDHYNGIVSKNMPTITSSPHLSLQPEAVPQQPIIVLKLCPLLGVLSHSR